MANLSVQALLAVMPVQVAAVLLVGFRVPARWAMPLVYVVAVVIAMTAWQMALAPVIAASIKGLFSTFDILAMQPVCSLQILLFLFSAAISRYIFQIPHYKST